MRRKLDRQNAVLLKTATLLLVTSALPAALRGQLPPRGINVNVANTPNVNVVNTPSVNVANTPTVNVGNSPTVTVGNTPSVNVANTPSVTVSNIATRPVLISNIDDPGRIPYQSTVSNMGRCSGWKCGWEFGSVPAGHRLVIQHISGTVGFDVFPAAAQVRIGSNALSTFFAPLILTTTPTGIAFTSFDQPIQVYFDSGQDVGAAVFLFGGTFDQGVGTMDISLFGYELDCTVAPCAPIAH